MREEFEGKNEGATISTQVRWLVNPYTIREKRQKGEIAASSVLFVVIGSKVAQCLVKNETQAAVVRYRVESYRNTDTDSSCKLCCRWGDFEDKCSSKHRSACRSGHHQTSEHSCNVAGCKVKQRSLCCHTTEKCPKCREYDTVFSSRYVKKTVTTRAVRQSRKIWLGGQASTRGVTGANRVALGTRQVWGIGGEGGKPIANQDTDDSREKEEAEEELDEKQIW